ncbi:MAG TPA: alpha-amylase family glycosyl hydrolase [Thermoanaerobaculia bacterium]|nr:alpha-amylase family glycosyl hydrolase [Thermoanaerobaculia bacterium]
MIFAALRRSAFPVLLLLACTLRAEAADIRFLSLRPSGTAGEWSAGPFDDWIVYHIMVDMFAKGSPANDGEITGWKHPNYAGGDLQGILEHADHIQKLGANAVWLSPIFAARSSHAYDATNYYRIGGAFGAPNRPRRISS